MTKQTVDAKTEWPQDALVPGTEEEAREYFRMLPPDIFFMLMRVGIEMAQEMNRDILRHRLIREEWRD